jgi:hypothetical protein
MWIRGKIHYRGFFTITIPPFTPVTLSSGHTNGTVVTVIHSRAPGITTP